MSAAADASPVAPEAADPTREKSERDLDALHGGGGGASEASEASALPPAADASSSLAGLLRAGEERAEARKLEQVKRAVELARVPVAAGDVEFLVREFDLEKAAAERVLRLAGGDAKAAARKLAGLPQ